MQSTFKTIDVFGDLIKENVNVKAGAILEKYGAHVYADIIPIKCLRLVIL